MNYEVVENRYEYLVKNIEQYFFKEENKVLFQKRNTLKIIDFENKKYVIKSFKIPHLLNKIVYRFFRDSKAKRSYLNSVKLLKLNVNTPKPIGYVEYKTALFFTKSYYISEFFDYDFEIRAVLKDKNFKDRETILYEFIKFTKFLHDSGVYHIDYSPGNIIVKKLDQDYIFFIIDVNRMQFQEFDLDLRMKSISKLTSDIDDNKFFTKLYADISAIDEGKLYSTLLHYLQEQKKYLENKKRLKKLKG